MVNNAEMIPSGNGSIWGNSASIMNCDDTQCSNLPPVFILGYTKRLGRENCDITAILNAATKAGFAWCIADNTFVDIFMNETDTKTLFWEHCIFVFTWRI